MGFERADEAEAIRREFIREMRKPSNEDYVLLAIVGLVVAYGFWMIFSGP